MEQKKSEFDKVLGAWDILVIAFGAMIGWGWVVSSGSWIQKGGVVGASIAFAIGGVMIFFIGLTYAFRGVRLPNHHHISVAGIPERLYVQRGRI